MTVWAVNHTPRIDTSSALQYGDIRCVNYRYVYGDEINPDLSMPGSIAKALDDAAREFDPARDYLLIVGDHLQLIDFVARLGALYYSFNVLRFDKKAGGYIPVRLSRAYFGPG